MTNKETTDRQRKATFNFAQKLAAAKVAYGAENADEYVKGVAKLEKKLKAEGLI